MKKSMIKKVMQSQLWASIHMRTDIHTTHTHPTLMNTYTHVHKPHIHAKTSWWTDSREKKLPGCGGWHKSLIPALGSQRQKDLCEFEASLVYRAFMC